MPILHVVIVRYMDGTPGVVIVGPFDGRQAADDFVDANRAKFEEKYGDQTTTFRVEPLMPPSCVFE